jgi:hypothetical protein
MNLFKNMPLFAEFHFPLWVGVVGHVLLTPWSNTLSIHRNTLSIADTHLKYLFFYLTAI